MAYKFVHGNWGQVIGRIHEDSGSTISDSRMPGLLIKEEK
jgi:hypothetical protein